MKINVRMVNYPWENLEDSDAYDSCITCFDQSSLDGMSYNVFVTVVNMLRRI